MKNETIFHKKKDDKLVGLMLNSLGCLVHIPSILKILPNIHSAAF